jgi:hypothetical protein
MKRIFLGLLLCLCALPALANDEIFAGRIGNTIIMKRSDGIEMKTHYRADHTLDGTVNGVPFKGLWAINSEGIACVAQWPELAGSPNPRCFAAKPNKVGDTWTGGRGGRTQTETILEGIQ